MHIKKQRLLTPGPTPLLPRALHAMMGSDIHHRTADFRKLYQGILRDLKEVMGTSNDVICLVSSGSGRHGIQHLQPVLSGRPRGGVHRRQIR